MIIRSTLLSVLVFCFASAIGCGGGQEAVQAQSKPKGHPCFEQNNMQACLVLGKRTLDKTRPDHGKARRLLSRACLVRDAEACALFGGLLQNGLGGPIDLQRAADALSVGCEGGQEGACLNLAALHNNPLNERKDPEQAKALLQRLCSSDPPSSRACEQLGDMYNDPNAPSDGHEALGHHNTACELGQKSACVAAATLTVRASTSSTDDKQAAARRLESLCEEDIELGCFELASLHQEGNIPGGSAAQAALLYRAVCDHEPPRGCYEAGRLYERGLIQARSFEATALYTRACEHGHDIACERRSMLAALQEATQP
jgi:TPR repeat protein